MPDNSDNPFEFELNGDKVYTGNQLPDQLPVSFTPFPDTLLRPLDEIAEIVKNPSRKTSRQRWGQDKLINQGQRSSCNAYMAAAMLMRAIYLSTGKWIQVAPEFIYMHINGGRDQGSMLDDGMKFVADVGCCKKVIGGEELIPYQSYQKNKISMEHMRVATEDAQDQRWIEVYQFPKESVEKCWHAILSCLAGRGVVGLAVHVGNDYMRSGVVAGFDRGPGNHAVAGDDVVCLTDNPKSIEDFRVVSPQSWGTRFADGGWTQLTYRHIETTMRYHGLYGCRSVALSRDQHIYTKVK
jgi:hypothetical protein